VYPGALLFALIASVAAHTVALLGVPQLDLSWLRPHGPTPRPIEARIVQVPSVAAVPPASTAKAASPAPRPTVQPKPGRPPAPATVESPAPLVEPREPAPSAVSPESVDGEPQTVAAVDPVTDTSGTQGLPTEAAPAPAEAAAEDHVAVVEAAAPALAPVPAPRQPAQHPIRHAAIVYDLRYGENPLRVGSVRHTFDVEGDTYRAETVAEATGVFAWLYGGRYVQRSRGRVGPDGLIPDEYFVMRGKPDRAETARFDWTQKKVSFTRRNETETKPIQPGVQDPLSMLHQLYFYQPLPQTAFLDIATSRKVNTYTYEVIGEELLETPIGIVATVHLRRDDEDSDRLELWLDPRRGYLPMKLYFVDRKGTIFEQVVREVTVELAR
jgi:hypothetical protein